MSIQRPWYKRYPAQFLSGTASLTFEQKGAYSIIIDIVYDNGGPLDLSDAQIAHTLGCHWHRWARIKRELIAVGKIEITPDGKLATRGLLPPHVTKTTPPLTSVLPPQVNAKKSNDFSRGNLEEEEEKPLSAPLLKKGGEKIGRNHHGKRRPQSRHDAILEALEDRRRERESRNGRSGSGGDP